MSTDVWAIKHMPLTLGEYVFFSERQKQIVTKIIEDRNFTGLLLSGRPGTGKTSLAYLIKNEYGLDDSDFLQIDCSETTGKADLESKVNAFAGTMVLNEEIGFKIILLDEAERLSAAAQDSLKGLIVKHNDNARFIFTCNKPNKIIEPIHSRCLEIKYETLDKDEMTARFVKILRKEKIKNLDIDVIEAYVESCYPDFRQLLVQAQANIVDGELQPYEHVVTDTTEFMVQALDYIESNDWEAARNFLSTNLSDDKWEECYRFLYDYLHETGKFKDNTKAWKAGIVIISDHLYRHSMVADPEINFASCLIRLSDI